MGAAVNLREKTMSNRTYLFVFLFSCVLKDILGAKNMACVQRTEDNHCCRFPFYYKGIKYRSCTYHGDINNQFWCFTEDFKYNKSVNTTWGYCKLTDSQCFVKTTDGNCCIFPFKYRGKEYKNCAATEGNPKGPYWCATKSEFDRSVNGSGWGFCAGSACYTCGSTISWDHCNKNMVEKICPYGYEFCAAFSREEKYDNNPNNITKIFKKDCALYSQCSTKPSPRCSKDSKQGGVSQTCSHECCHGQLCNTGESAMKNAHGCLALLLAVVSAITVFPHG
ncbi:hypothetical protein ACROYT_G007831 [Oculina patagonica]